MSVKLVLKGFDDMLKELERAGGNVEKTSKTVLLKSAQMFANELIKQTNSAPVSTETKNAMIDDFVEPHILKANEYFVVAETGFKMGDYDPKDLSGGFIAQFNNYGTKNRHTKKGDYRGSLDKLEFVQRAHKAIGSKVRKMQKAELEKAFKEAFK